MTTAERIAQLCQPYTEAGLTVGAAIPVEKLRIACERFPIPHVQVVALLDTSTWSNRGTGLAICADGLYWRGATAKAALLGNLVGKAGPVGSTRTRLGWAEFATAEVRLIAQPAAIQFAADATLNLEGVSYPPARLLGLLQDLQQLVRAPRIAAPEADGQASTPAPSTTPGATEVEADAQAVRRLIGVLDEPLLRELIQQGVTPASLAWVVALDRLELDSGDALDRAFLAQVRGVGRILFASSGPGRLRLWRDLDLVAHVDGTPTGLVLAVTPRRQTSPVKQGQLELTREFVAQAGVGDWTRFWAEAIGDRLGGEAATDLWLAAIDRWEPSQGQLAGLQQISATIHLATGSGDELRTWPPVPLPDRAATRTWDVRDGALWLGEFAATGFVTHTLRRVATLCGGAASAPLGADLPGDRRSRRGHRADFARSGTFEARFHPDHVSASALLKISAAGEVILETAGEGATRCGAAWQHDRSLVLTRSGGDRYAVVVADAEVGATVVAALPALALLVDRAQWPPVPLLDGQRPGWLSLLCPGVSSLRVDDEAPVAFESLAQVDVDEAVGPGLATLRLVWSRGGEPGGGSFIGPVGIIYSLAQALHTRRMRASVEARGIADLYTERNRLKADNLMYALFADIVVLNRSLEADGPVADLLNSISTASWDFAGNKSLRDRTIQRLALLGLGLPRIKQKFEILAAYYPYYWLKAESDWLDTAFGAEVASSLIPRERDRLVGAVRRQVRAVHASIQRPLAEIEAALRPIEDLLVTDEVRNTTSARVRRHIPLAVSGAGVASALVLGGPVAFLALGLGGHLTATLSQRFEKDKVSAARLRGVAEKVLTWWQVFMRTLAVSMYEAAEFIHAENDRAMVRDRRVIDSLDANRRQVVVGGLAASLRRVILNESQGRFAEIIEGSGVRLERISADIRATVEVRVRNGIDDFCGSLALTRPGDLTGGA